MDFKKVVDLSEEYDIKPQYRDIPDELVTETKEWLGDKGIEHFKEIKRKHKQIAAVYMVGKIPHSVHFNEGMTVRNFMRSTESCKDWNDIEFDDNWVSLIERCIE